MKYEYNNCSYQQNLLTHLYTGLLALFQEEHVHYLSIVVVVKCSPSLLIAGGIVYTLLGLTLSVEKRNIHTQIYNNFWDIGAVHMKENFECNYFSLKAKLFFL